jgi:hypothetical protein
MQHTSDGSETTMQQGEEEPTLVLRLVDLKLYHLSETGPDARHASDTEFLNFALSIAQLEGEGLDRWTVEDRRDFLNWCLETGVLEAKDGALRRKGPGCTGHTPGPKTDPQQEE